MDAIKTIKKGLAGLLVLALPAMPLQADDKQTLRGDAFSVMAVAMFVPGIAVYCDKFVEYNERRAAAVQSWNKRHDALFRQAVRVVEWSGGMSAETRRKFDRMALQMVRETMDGQDDKGAYCSNLADQLDLGSFDLQNGEMGEAAQRIMAAPLD